MLYVALAGGGPAIRLGGAAMSRVLSSLRRPVVAAPMAGGASTPKLVAAVSEAGGLGFLAAGYLTPARLIEDVEATARRTQRPFGVNLFVPSEVPVDEAAVAAYVQRLTGEAQRLGVAPGVPRADDDAYAEK